MDLKESTSSILLDSSIQAYLSLIGKCFWSLGWTKNSIQINCLIYIHISLFFACILMFQSNNWQTNEMMKVFYSHIQLLLLYMNWSPGVGIFFNPIINWTTSIFRNLYPTLSTWKCLGFLYFHHSIKTIS